MCTIHVHIMYVHDWYMYVHVYLYMYMYGWETTIFRQSTLDLHPLKSVWVSENYFTRTIHVSTHQKLNIITHVYDYKNDAVLYRLQHVLPVVSVLPRGSAVLYDAFAGAALTGP